MLSRVSPRKDASTQSRSGVLRPSGSAGNRNPTKHSSILGLKAPSKVIKGSAKTGKMRSSQLKEQIAVEIFEDLTGDEF